MAPAPRHPAELGVERVLGAGRRQQHDRRRFRVDGLAVLREREVVDARAFERDRALHARRLDRDARARGEHGLAGLHLAGRRGRWPRRRRRARLAGRRRCRARRACRAPARSARAPGGCCCVCCCCFSCASWRCFSICGMPTKYCQPSSTIAESTMARMVFFWSFIVVLSAAARAACRARVSAPANSAIDPLERHVRARRAGRSGRSHARLAGKRGMSGARSRAGGAAPGCARPHCRPSSTP